ncbi:MAG: hypothetical protein ABJM06_14830 [Gilvibacter sp.]
MKHPILILVLLLCASCIQNNKDKVLVNSEVKSKLETGWYFLNTNQVKFSRKLYKSEELYEIEAKPIVNAKHVIYMEKYKSDYGDIGLGIQLNKKGTEIWKNATSYAYQRSIQLGLVIDDTLVYAVDLRAPIETGESALNRGDLTLKELQRFEKKIKTARSK